MQRHGDPVRAKHAELCSLGEAVGLQADKCPLCGSQRTEDEFISHIESVRSEIQKVATTIVALLEQERRLTQQLEAKQAELDMLKQRHLEHESRRQQIDKLRIEVNREAAALGISLLIGESDPEHILSVIEQHRATNKLIESGIGWLESSGVTEMIRALELELADVKRQSNDAFGATTKTEQAINKVKDAQKIAKSLLGEIIDEQLAELSPLIEELYRRLRPHVEWTNIRYRLRGDVRRMLSFEVGEGLNPSFVFSSGQRRAAGLAFLLAVHLSRPWCKLNTLILDDPVQHIDDFRALNLTEVLVAVRKTARQIICCVEDEALGRLICRRLRSGSESDGRLLTMLYTSEDGVGLGRDEVIGPSQQFILVRA